MDLKLPKMLNGDYEPHFSLKHMFKDVQLAIHLANSMNLDTPTAAVTAGVLFGAIKRGWGDLDFSSLYRLYATMARSAEPAGGRRRRVDSPYDDSDRADRAEPTPRPRRSRPSRRPTKSPPAELRKITRSRRSLSPRDTRAPAGAPQRIQRRLDLALALSDEAYQHWRGARRNRRPARARDQAAPEWRRPRALSQRPGDRQRDAARPGLAMPACVTTAKGKLSADVFITATEMALSSSMPSASCASGSSPGWSATSWRTTSPSKTSPTTYALLHFARPPDELRAFEAPHLHRAVPRTSTRALASAAGWDIWLRSMRSRRRADSPAYRPKAPPVPGVAARLVRPNSSSSCASKPASRAGAMSSPKKPSRPRPGSTARTSTTTKGATSARKSSRASRASATSIAGSAASSPPAASRSQPGWRVFAPGDLQKAVGKLTSAAWSFALAKPVALGYLRRGSPRVRCSPARPMATRRPSKSPSAELPLVVHFPVMKLPLLLAALLSLSLAAARADEVALLEIHIKGTGETLPVAIEFYEPTRRTPSRTSRNSRRKASTTGASFTAPSRTRSCKTATRTAAQRPQPGRHRRPRLHPAARDPASAQPRRRRHGAPAGQDQPHAASATAASSSSASPRCPNTTANTPSSPTSSTASTPSSASPRCPSTATTSRPTASASRASESSPTSCSRPARPGAKKPKRPWWKFWAPSASPQQSAAETATPADHPKRGGRHGGHSAATQPQ